MGEAGRRWKRDPSSVLSEGRLRLGTGARRSGIWWQRLEGILVGTVPFSLCNRRLRGRLETF